MLREQRMYATHQFCAKNRVMNRFVRTKGESEKDDEIWVEKILLLFLSALLEN